LHPLQTIASPEQGVESLRGVAFAVSGDKPALAWAERIVSALEGEALRIAERRRPHYHAAAVMASNYLVGVLDAAVVLMEAAGIDEPTARRALAPLARTSASNVLEKGSLDALTGPLRRGDRGTIVTHLAALAQSPASVQGLYRAAGRHLLTMARRGGLPEAQAAELDSLLAQG
jgi:predicted short-subunit dehydrogenase-like oxidoreductase (DUF2520 family)